MKKAKHSTSNAQRATQQPQLVVFPATPADHWMLGI